MPLFSYTSCAIALSSRSVSSGTPSDQTLTGSAMNLLVGAPLQVHVAAKHAIEREQNLDRPLDLRQAEHVVGVDAFAEVGRLVDLGAADVQHFGDRIDNDAHHHVAAV